MYAKIINKETGLCEVGIGANIDFYKSLEMSEMDVTQSEIDNHWYLKEKLDTDEYKNQLAQKAIEGQKSEIKAKLDEIDSKSTRALRANETARLQELENEAESLRKQLNNL
ncbi:MAG: hypothetical protein LKG27_06265 [Clostridiaceae bacterium]|jgi:hypothetical protein|nr:hypothetical protein [Clostridiaceae bacterium]